MADPSKAGGGLARETVESVTGSLPDGRWRLLCAYADLLRAQARRLSLISHKAETEIPMHVVDSAAFVQVALSEPGVAKRNGVADLGTGAGLPGAVVAIIRPDLRVTLVDSRNSRVVFLKQVERELGLDNIEIVHGRLEGLRGRRQFDVIASRALGSIGETLKGSLELLAEGGRLVMYKGPSWPSEQDEAVRIAESAGCEMGWIREVALPGFGRTTWFVEFHVKRA